MINDHQLFWSDCASVVWFSFSFNSYDMLFSHAFCFKYTWQTSLYSTPHYQHTYTRTEEKCGMSQTAELLLQCLHFRLMIVVAVLLRVCNPELKNNKKRWVTFMVDNLFSDSLNLSLISFLSLEIYLWGEDMKLAGSFCILWFHLVVSSLFFIRGICS